MSTTVIIVIIAVAAIVVIAGLALSMVRRRKLRQQLRPLSEAARESYLAQWPAIQEKFVDQPDLAVAQARQLVISVLNDRGHPAESHQQIADDLAAGYPQAVSHLKSAHQLTHQLSPATADSSAPTEDLRQALIHYRATFDELVGGTHESLGSPARPLEPGQDGIGATDDVLGADEPAGRKGPVSEIAPTDGTPVAREPGDEAELGSDDQADPAGRWEPVSDAKEMRR